MHLKTILNDPTLVLTISSRQVYGLPVLITIGDGEPFSRVPKVFVTIKDIRTDLLYEFDLYKLIVVVYSEEENLTRIHYTSKMLEQAENFNKRYGEIMTNFLKNLNSRVWKHFPKGGSLCGYVESFSIDLGGNMSVKIKEDKTCPGIDLSYQERFATFNFNANEKKFEDLFDEVETDCAYYPKAELEDIEW